MQAGKFFSKIVGSVIAVLVAVCVFALAGCTDGDDGNGEQYRQGEFYSLQDAYDNNFISLEDLKNIAYYYNGGTRYNEEIMADFTPAEKVALSDETQAAIKQSRAKILREEKRPDGTPLVANVNAEHVRIYGYYGTYNGSVAVMIEDDYTSYDCAMWMIEIEGVNIYYNDGNRITVWKPVVI